MNNNKDIVIFDLDGTLADIDNRRTLAHKGKGRLDWKIFHDPKNIDLDLPNWPVIAMAKMLHKQGKNIVIFSGRSKATKDATINWLKQYGVPYYLLKMRPTGNKFNFMPDDDLKQHWLDTLFPGDQKDRILAIYDDRNKVVDMWRKNGLACFQVAPGNF
jgi:phosphoglycolate phosphatase-like HAD superfamily hydrolase